MKNLAESVARHLEHNKAISRDTAAMIRKDFKDRTKIALETFLLDQGLVTKEALLKAFSEYYEIPPFDVEGYFFLHLLLREFPKDFLRANIIIPVEILAGENIITIVANDPSDETLLPKIGAHASYDVIFFVGLAQDILDQIQDYYDQPITVTDEYEDVPAQEEEEKKALEIAEEDIIDRTK